MNAESANNFTSHDPATGEVVWTGRAADDESINAAIAAARLASEQWAATPLANRIAYLEAFGQRVAAHRDEFVLAICRSTGKPRWESATEVDSVIAKVALTIRAFQQRCPTSENDSADTLAATRYKPHGILAVFGPFNFPAHLPNGHVLPALVSGNTVLFKPSEQTPLVGDVYARCWQECDLPAGVFQVLHGGRATGETLAKHPGIDGVLFTGSAQAGLAINRTLVEHPGKIVALEMGGNNPLVVHRVADLRAAAYWTIQSAFITAGQRCTCARRLIVTDSQLLSLLVEMTRGIRVGRYTDQPEPFIGPVISPAAAKLVLQAQTKLIERGARPLLEMKLLDRRALLSPGIVDVTDIHREDVEIFGPLLQVIRVSNLDEAIREANDTRYGLAASLFSDDRESYEHFYKTIRAGVVNWNRPTTGASGGLPFGGIGLSGNHRPSGFFAVDYCSYPVASMESPTLELPKNFSPGLDISR